MLLLNWCLCQFLGLVSMWVQTSPLCEHRTRVPTRLERWQAPQPFSMGKSVGCFSSAGGGWDNPFDAQDNPSPSWALHPQPVAWITPQHTATRFMPGSKSPLALRLHLPLTTLILSLLSRAPFLGFELESLCLEKHVCACTSKKHLPCISSSSLSL